MAWLRGHTGEPWRFLTKTEHDRLAKAAGPRENTLDHLIGFSPTSEEARDARQTIEREGLVSWIREAGESQPGMLSTAGVEHPVYDVGGNLSEWVFDENEKLVLSGGSFLETTDSREPDPRRDVRAAGLRLAKGPRPDKSAAPRGEVVPGFLDRSPSSKSAEVPRTGSAKAPGVMRPGVIRPAAPMP